jgi:hypothetical protein
VTCSSLERTQGFVGLIYVRKSAPLFLIGRIGRGKVAEKFFASERGISRKSDERGAVLCVAVGFTELACGRVGLDASASVSPRMIGSERGKDPNGSLRTSGGSDNSISPGLLVI